MANNRKTWGLRPPLPWLACALAALWTAPAARAQATETVLFNFAASSPNGATPTTGVTLDAAGNIYGAATAGGAFNVGVVYKVNAAGKETVLHSFTGGADGGTPKSGVIFDSAGNLYGISGAGGGSNAGVVYKIDAAGNETVLYNFTGNLDGDVPSSGLILDTSGNLYGATYSGGAYGAGVIFKLDTAGHETVLYNFMGGANGNHPTGNIVRDSGGNFYGTTAYGGTNLPICGSHPVGCGVVYKVDSSGYETVLHTFTAGSDGAEPNGLSHDAANNLYGTTNLGGAGSCPGGCGIVFKITAAHQETILYTFLNESDGYGPQSGVTLDSAGNLYGTTYAGGPNGGGVVYKLDTTGQETILYGFQSYPPSPNGFKPAAGVTLDGQGNIYGVTEKGGPAQFGALFELNTAGQESVFACFTGGAQGNTPKGGVIPDSAGNLYGTTYYGGPGNTGVVYELDTAGRETVLYNFTGGADGGYPIGPVMRDGAGRLYGIASAGGSGLNGSPPGGVLYELSGTGETASYSFPKPVTPQMGLVHDSAGNIYGTTFNGGLPGCSGYGSCGVVYKVDLAGQLGTFYSFTGGADGGNPNGSLILDSDGNLYGATYGGGAGGCGVVFKLNASANETVLYTFGCGADGNDPGSGVVRDASGNLYGVTNYGGATDEGVVYKIDPAGNETVLYNLTGPNAGDFVSVPYSSLTLDSVGNLFGTTMYGGITGCLPNSSCGLVYQISPSGQYTVLYSFTGDADGGNPEAPVTVDAKGHIYGTTTAGGANGGGVLFKLTAVTSGAGLP